MILDSSAIVSVIRGELGHERIVSCLAREPDVRVGAPTLVETAMVLTGRLGRVGGLALDRLIREKRIDVLSFSDAHWRVANTAFIRFGKGRHPAKLNLGDCFTYAVARVAGEPLLCVGDDFSQTDLELVSLD
ncbi:MAG: PIN domain-containing protein [Pseudonocardiaceae bacterium]|nr:PIN domain-containing protein [Pseudonocardiaceae bacterium]